MKSGQSLISKQTLTSEPAIESLFGGDHVVAMARQFDHGNEELSVS